MGYMDPATPRFTYDFDAEAQRLLDLIAGVNADQARVALTNELQLAYYRGRVALLEEQRGGRHG